MIEDVFGITHLTDGEGGYLYKGNEYGKSCFKYEWCIRLLDKQPETIFDIGAYDGGDTLRFSLWFPNAKIYTIEASPSNYERIKKLNLPNNVVLNYAMYDRDGVIDFNRATGGGDGEGQDGAMGSVFKVSDTYLKAFPHVQLKETVEVPCRTFNTVCLEQGVTSVDIAHIDVEGAGKQVLMGMGNILPKIVYIEKSNSSFFINSGDGDLDPLMRKKGYKKELELPNDILYVRRDLL